MQARQHKHDANKGRCDRCQQPTTGTTECEFSFRHPLRYWKPLWEKLKEKRLTRKRAQRMGAEWEFDWHRPPAYWMDLCASCWKECSQPWDGFPMTFWETVLKKPTTKAPKPIGSKARA